MSEERKDTSHARHHTLLATTVTLSSFVRSTVLLLPSHGKLMVVGRRVGMKLDLARSAGPNCLRTRGIGSISSAMHPSKVDAHFVVSLWNILSANSGNAAPNTERMTVFVASAEAAAKR